MNEFNNILKNIKHDLINPINAMIGYSELLMEMSNNNLSSIDIKSIHKSSKDILSIINKMFLKKNDTANSDIGSFFTDANLNHSIRTHLSSVIGISEIIIEDSISTFCEDDIVESIKKINQSGKMLLRQFNDLHKYSEMDNNNFIESYFANQYLTESSIRNYNFKLKNNFPDKMGKILVIDDEDINLDLIGKIIINYGHEVHSSQSAKEAIHILERLNYNIDLILLDLIMPDINGIDLLEMLKKKTETYNIPVIMLSAVDDIDSIINCISNGAEDFLIKPINQILLNARISSALDKKFFHDREIKYQERIKAEQKISEKLLLNILPKSVAERLKAGETLIADDFDSATVLFADLEGFTQLSSNMEAKDILLLLNHVFTAFDKLAAKYSLEKIKTIGDNYMVVGGIPEENKDHAVLIIEMAIEMLAILPKINKQLGHNLNIRIGINSGPVSAGVIGENKFIYDIWGDTVNVASKMESYGKNGKIHVSNETYNLIKNKYKFENSKEINIPGKGLMNTHYISIK